jgi:hypothetical protein
MIGAISLRQTGKFTRSLGAIEAMGTAARPPVTCSPPARYTNSSAL